MEINPTTFPYLSSPTPKSYPFLIPFHQMPYTLTIAASHLSASISSSPAKPSYRHTLFSAAVPPSSSALSLFSLSHNLTVAAPSPPFFSLFSLSLTPSTNNSRARLWPAASTVSHCSGTLYTSKPPPYVIGRFRRPASQRMTMKMFSPMSSLHNPI
ncbi:hypothetical protein HAX54_045883 [Datura stramonium]|uniref:Uncharacterized protein n=1 Tax=Datura stramonium TaxID=4076 RepID=A0ABS8WG99_DATST|nr:hypothetical protein [Datura stramonium]